MSADRPHGQVGWARHVPMTAWLRTYDRTWLRSDLTAGVAVAALIIPKNLGYADIAGIPLQNGLYAAAIGAIVYSVFGTSRQISTGPSSGLAAVAASAVVAAGISGIDHVASFVAMVTLGIRWPVPCPRPVQDGLDRPIPFSSSSDRVLVWRRSGRSDR